MIGVGLIGTGFMGKCHALAWTSVGAVFGDVPEIRRVHLADSTAQSVERHAREFGFARASADWRAVIDDPDVDVVSITTPNQFHAEMALAALKRGKHVWCEKPMAPAFADAEAMAQMARAAGRVAAIGYNYIQSPAIRHIGVLLSEHAIGDITHLRIEMDEDFMADPATEFGIRHDSASGYGAIDDFGVHTLSLVHQLFGRVSRVMCEMAKPYAARRTVSGEPRAVETYDIASVLVHLENGASGTIQVNRAAWGRKGRIAVQIFGSRGAILFDQERFNEIQLYSTTDRPTEQGFRTILMGPVHAPYGRFIPAPGHGLGFNELKIIECREVIRAIETGQGRVIGFDDGLEIERTVHAMAQSFAERRWVDVR